MVVDMLNSPKGGVIQHDIKFNGVGEGALVSLPKHSYWFDFWLFVMFDIAFFLVMYFIVP
uniref:Uncharacterized protein n=1 Tax=Oncorhynchus mykiss TaxID=8022 RepID=A0A8C7PB78_ONCMY